MELLEMSADAVASDDHDEDCYFCRSKGEPKTLTNALADDPEDDDPGAIEGLQPEGIAFKNDSSKLGAALGGTPDLAKTDDGLDVGVAAHHLIPGKASLTKSKIMDHVGVNGEKTGNIGYDVNSRPNGVWLPGNYAIRPWGKKGVSFHKSTGILPQTYAFAAIKARKAQFHDAHEDYNTFVVGVLDKIAAKLARGESVVCPEQKKKKKKKKENSTKSDEDLALEVLVSRLHTVSGRMKRMLVFPASNWKDNVWTSAFSQSYIAARPHDD